MLSDMFDFLAKVTRVIRGQLWFVRGVRFRSLGRSLKLRGGKGVSFGRNVCIGDVCWIEAVRKYKRQSFSPIITIGDRVAMSDLVHVSCIGKLEIGADCLIGSKVYIGDHSHGSMPDYAVINPPALRDLADQADVAIGRCCWIGDGAVILAGTNLADGCVVGANSVVKGLRVERAALVAGVPAKVVRYF